MVIVMVMKSKLKPRSANDTVPTAESFSLNEGTSFTTPCQSGQRKR